MNGLPFVLGMRPRLAIGMALVLVPTLVDAQASVRVNNVYQVAAIGTATANCQAFRDVLASLVDPAVDNHYLLGLEPGDYDCGTTPIVLPDGVVVEGAGRDVTTIEGDVDNALQGVIHIGGDEVTIRDLSVVNRGSGDFGAIAVSVWNLDPSQPEFRIERSYLDPTDFFIGVSLLLIDAVGVVSLTHFEEEIDARDGSFVLAEYSQLEASPMVDATSGVKCLFSYDILEEPLTTDCQ